MTTSNPGAGELADAERPEIVTNVGGRPGAAAPALRTGAWYGDRVLDLPFPPNWDVTMLWPRTPPRLSDRDIEVALSRPIGRPPLADLCRGRKRPLVIVDDMNRPTPAARVLPWVLQQFAEAGIQPRDVTILMATGSHGPPRPEIVTEKLGQAAAGCRILIHDARRRTARIGRTSSGTPVLVNRAVPAADFVMGIGGVYPNGTAGFGGGTKLAIGVLDIRVISRLHHGTQGSGWGADGLQGGFRRELDDIAELIGLDFTVSTHVDSDREIVRVCCGDPKKYLTEEIAFASDAFRAPMPGDADVVIANAFPNDLSLTFALAKGDFPLRQCAPETSRILIAACSEGEGFHGIYPVVRIPPLHWQRDRLGRLSLLTVREIAAKAAGRFQRILRGPRAHSVEAPQVESGLSPEAPAANPVWLYRTAGETAPSLPTGVRDARIVERWGEILEAVSREQRPKTRLRAIVYPCAPLQVLDASA